MTPEKSHDAEPNIYRSAIEARNYRWTQDFEDTLRSAHMASLKDSMVDKTFKRLFRVKAAKAVTKKTSRTNRVVTDATGGTRDNVGTTNVTGPVSGNAAA